MTKKKSKGTKINPKSSGKELTQEENVKISLLHKLRVEFTFNPLNALKLCALILTAITILLALFFFCFSLSNNVIMFSIFSCCISCFGFFLAIKDFKNQNIK